ncbi:hypothetical protein ALC62_03483 [Cyphomyrmex costatus]|uniref:Uncharacterized protein n=1 Tax=Cyphomyrmex costatus TaxID=456900 RepID=A0A151ILD0_9HYME|nr:hypothetical protein ALC62_03483 [Cyphomyrmex costatus]
MISKVVHNNSQNIYIPVPEYSIPAISTARVNIVFGGLPTRLISAYVNPGIFLRHLGWASCISTSMLSDLSSISELLLDVFGATIEG